MNVSLFKVDNFHSIAIAVVSNFRLLKESRTSLGRQSGSEADPSVHSGTVVRVEKLDDPMIFFF